MCVSNASSWKRKKIKTHPPHNENTDERDTRTMTGDGLSEGTDQDDHELRGNAAKASA
jgi:hypothetical protein